MTKRFSSYGIKFLINLHLSLNVDIITQPLINLVNIMAEIAKNNPISTIQYVVEKLDYSKLKAKEDRKGLVRSGETMYLDLQRMHTTLIINGKKMVEDTDDEQEEQKSLISRSIGEVDKNLICKLKDDNEDYRPFLVETFKKIFQYAEAEVPNDAIIQELITNCNQAGYDGCLYMELAPILSDFRLMIKNHTRTIHIDCNNSNCAELKINEKMDIAKIGSVDPKEQALVTFSSSLQFKLETQDNKEKVEYTDGKLSLIIPKELLEDKGLLSRFIEVIKILLEKAFGIKIGKENTNVIEHDFDNPNSSVTNPKIKGVHEGMDVVA